MPPVDFDSFDFDSSCVLVRDISHVSYVSDNTIYKNIKNSRSLRILDKNINNIKILIKLKKISYLYLYIFFLFPYFD